MRDILVIEYIREACELYRDDYLAIADFWQWFEWAVLPTAVQADWYEPHETRDDLGRRRGQKEGLSQLTSQSR